VGTGIGYGWRPLYFRIMWFFGPIEGSCAQANIWDKRTISGVDYRAFLEYGAAALSEIWRAVCSCGVSAESRWKDHTCLFMHLAYAEPGTEHIVTFERSPTGYWTWPERAQIE
jgi:hypothetical protein